jgi:hypothetical protein
VAVAVAVLEDTLRCTLLQVVIILQYNLLVVMVGMVLRVTQMAVAAEAVELVQEAW